MHVPGQRGRAAIAAELGGGETIGAEARARSALLARHADREKTFLMHVAKILDRERRIAVVLRGARREHPRAERSRLFDQVGVVGGELEAYGIEDRRVALLEIEAADHGSNLAEEIEDRRVKRLQRSTGVA